MMPRNHRVAKDFKKYSLRLEPEPFNNVQRIVMNRGMSMNALLQKIVNDFLDTKYNKESQ